MTFIKDLLGGGNTILNAAFALGAVVVLILLALWLLKLVFRASSNVGRGRNRRLRVVDTLAIDPKRQLIIIRRDNVEHLIMTGGPQDLVIENGIDVEEVPVANTRRPVPVVPARPTPRPAVKPPVAAVAAPAPVPMKPAAPAISAVPAPAPSPAPAIAVPATPPQAANSVSALGRLRELKPANGRRSASLRHTGLMRPVSQMEPATFPMENPADAQPDSGKEVVNAPSGQTEFGDTSSPEHSDGYTADRN